MTQRNSSLTLKDHDLSKAEGKIAWPVHHIRRFPGRTKIAYYSGGYKLSSYTIHLSLAGTAFDISTVQYALGTLDTVPICEGYGDKGWKSHSSQALR
jgi:hypothetical protein